MRAQKEHIRQLTIPYFRFSLPAVSALWKHLPQRIRSINQRLITEYTLPYSVCFRPTPIFVDRHATERVFHRPSDYATFRLSRYYRNGTLHSHNPYPPTPQGRQVTKYRYTQSADIRACSRILWKIQGLSACKISTKKQKLRSRNHLLIR